MFGRDFVGDCSLTEHTETRESYQWCPCRLLMGDIIFYQFLFDKMKTKNAFSGGGGGGFP